MDEEDDNDVTPSHEPLSGMSRWVPTAVVFAAVIGFFVLAWCAYHAGTQSLKEEDLLVVEADKTPMKEKPTNPGGMQFPNQDKTVFDTFSNAPNQPPKVERVLPAPEEPIAQTPSAADISETTTYVNQKPNSFEAIAAVKPEQLTENATPPAPISSPTPSPLEPQQENNDAVTAYTKLSNAAATPAPAVVAPPQVTAVTKPAAAPAKFEPPKATHNGSSKVQLGSYRSEEEAQGSWSDMQKKFKSLNNRTPIILKADIPGKGIYYRLRLSGFNNADDAKSFCNALSDKGQACLPI